MFERVSHHNKSVQNFFFFFFWGGGGGGGGGFMYIHTYIYTYKLVCMKTYHIPLLTHVHAG